jgi:hypothetical protein
MSTPDSITIEIDGDLSRVTDSRLMLLWHVAQANPAPHGDKAAGRLVEKIGFEIIRRWLRGVPPELYHHQSRDYYWSWLGKFAKYEPGGPNGTPEWDEGTWVARQPEDGDR